MCRHCNIPVTGSATHPFVRLSFRDLSAFVDFLKGHNLTSCFREHRDLTKEELNYTAYDSATGIFVACNAVVPSLQKFMGLGESTGGYYSHSGFHVDQNLGVLKWGNKRYFVQALKAINVNATLVSSLGKIKVGDLTKITDGAGEEETDGQISTDQQKAAPFPTQVQCDTVDSIVQQVTVDIGEQRYSGVVYKVIVNDWGQVVTEAINKFEKQVVDQGIMIVSGSLELIGVRKND